MIQFDDVEVEADRRSGAAVLSGVSFTIDRGSLACVTGPTGSGKSTVLSVVSREARASSGQVLVDGEDVGALSRREVPGLRRRVAQLHASPRLLSGRTLKQNVAYALQLRGVSGPLLESRVKSALEEVGLLHHARRLASEATADQRVRCALARALVGAPEVLLVDEPSASLDAERGALVLELLQRAVHRGITVVVATHHPERFAEMEPHWIELEGGRVVRDERPRDLSAAVAPSDVDSDDVAAEAA